jgi:RimJ/RimL family protein N-acetyltransferase
VLRHGLATLGLPEVIAEIHPDNARSLRVAEKLDLRRRGEVLHQGEPALRYGLTPAEPGLLLVSG